MPIKNYTTTISPVNTVNEIQSWDNDWVWVVEFKVTEGAK